MWKSIAFFLAVFTLGLIGLLVVSGDLSSWLHPKPAEEAGAPEEASVTSAGAPQGDGVADLNLIKVPIYDVKKGRLEYTIWGHLDENELKNLQDIKDLESGTLRDGRIEIPIYDEVAEGIPAVEGERKPKSFTLTFARAEYRSYRRKGLTAAAAKGERDRDVVTLFGEGDRGKGTTDDGSTFTFEELTFEIKWKPEAETEYLIQSGKRVAIRYGQLRLESPNGLKGFVDKTKGLERLIFNPPVRTYIDPGAAKLFSLAMPGEEGGKAIARDPPAGGSEKPAPAVPEGARPEGAKAIASGKAEERPERPASKVAITCAGPLTLLLAPDPPDPPAIRFEKDVTIYPLEGAEPEPGAPPPLADSKSFRCQVLSIELDPAAHPPSPARAVATWEGGRVQAHYMGKVVDGDRLVWTLPKKPAAGGGDEGKDVKPPRSGVAADYGEAVLTGKPTLTANEGHLEAGEIVFRFAEDKILLLGGLSGVFRADFKDLGDPRRSRGGSRSKEAAQAPGTSSEKTDSPAPGSAPQKASKLPGEWEFSADEGEVVFADVGGEGAPGTAKRTDKTISKLVARSSRDGGLQVRNLGDGRYRMEGRSLEYDFATRAVSLGGSPDSPPRFHHGRNEGTASSIRLRLEEGLVTFRDGVRVRIEDVEALGAAVKAAKDPGPTEAGRPEERKDPGAMPDGPIAPPGEWTALPPPDDRKSAPLAGGTAEKREKDIGPVELLARELDMRFEPGRLLGIVARSTGSKEAMPVEPVVLQSVQDVPGRPGYRLAGGKMEWDPEGEVATVEGFPAGAEGSIGSFKPELQFEGGSLLADHVRFLRKTWRVDLDGDVHVRHGFELRAGRAEVDLNEELRVNDGGDCGPARELKRVKAIRAWAAEGKQIEFVSKKGNYHGRAQEATWDSGSQALHISGPGRQEMVLTEPGRESKLEAKDIVYRCADKLLVLTGDVRCDVRIQAQELAGSPVGQAVAGTSRGGGKAAKASVRTPGGRGGKEGEISFRCETNRVEITIDETDDQTDSGLVPLSLHATEKILLTNDDYGVQIRGDELFYDHGTRTLVLFSKEKRTQTLTRRRPADAVEGAKTAGPGETKVDQIDARQIWLTYHLTEDPQGKSSMKSAIVKFRDDVTATFFAPIKTDLLKAAGGGEPKEEWKMQSDNLGLRIVPTKEKDRAVQLALASGKVIFSSGDYMALSNEAVYEESFRRLTLRGDERTPARLIMSPKGSPLSGNEVFIQNLGGKELRGGRWEKPWHRPEGLEELRPPTTDVQTLLRPR